MSTSRSHPVPVPVGVESISNRSLPARRLVVVLVAVGVLLSSAAGCGRSSAVERADGGGPNTLPDPRAATAPVLPITVTGADGREVVVHDISRIVPLAGSLAEIVFALGYGDHVVARDVSATFDEVQDRPLVTKGHDVSAESVLSLRPTLVLAQTDTGPPEALDPIRAAGVPVVVFDLPGSIRDIRPRVELVASALGVAPAADALNREIEQRIADARTHIPEGVDAPKVAFLYMRGQAGVYLIGGPGSGADSMIAAAGGVDAGTAMGLDRTFTPITSEALVDAQPDVILMTTTGLDSIGGIEALVEIPGIAQTPAGVARRIVTIEDGQLYSFGPRTPDALRDLIVALHEEQGG